MNNLYYWGKPIQNHQFSEISQGIYSIQFSQPILEVSCGYEHLIIRTETQIYAMGENNQGQLGLMSDLTKDDLKIMKISIKSKIVQISCGAYHTLILNQLGQVYSAGQGKDGALGIGDGSNIYNFKFVISSIVKISAGKDHSLALSKTKVFGWGNSKDGQLGLMNKKINYFPKQLNVYPCYDFYAGPKLSFFLTNKGVFATGLNHNGQLGIGHQNSVFTPKRLNIEEKINKIVGSNYSIAITENNCAYLWGSGVFGKFLYPTKMEFLNNIKNICIGSTFGIALGFDCKITVWGANCNGELGLYDKSGKDYPFENSQLSQLNLQDLDAGHNYVVAYCNAKEKHEGLNWENSSINSGKIKSVIQDIEQGKRFNINKFQDTEIKIKQVFNESESQNKQVQTSNQKKYINQRYQNVEYLKKSKGNEDNYSLPINQMLAENRHLKNQNEMMSQYIHKIRHEYLALLDIVQNNKFLKAMMTTENENYLEEKMKIYQQGAGLDTDKDQLSQQLGQLKDILHNIQHYYQ